MPLTKSVHVACLPCWGSDDVAQHVAQHGALPLFFRVALLPLVVERPENASPDWHTE